MTAQKLYTDVITGNTYRTIFNDRGRVTEVSKERISIGANNYYVPQPEDVDSFFPVRPKVAQMAVAMKHVKVGDEVKLTFEAIHEQNNAPTDTFDRRVCMVEIDRSPDRPAVTCG